MAVITQIMARLLTTGYCEFDAAVREVAQLRLLRAGISDADRGDIGRELLRVVDELRVHCRLALQVDVRKQVRRHF